MLEFTVAWLKRLQDLWKAAATSDHPVSDECFRNAGQTNVPPQPKPAFSTATSLVELFQGREALISTAFFVAQMLPEWTQVVADDTVSTKGIKKHVRRVEPTHALNLILTQTIQQWTVRIRMSICAQLADVSDVLMHPCTGHNRCETCKPGGSMWKQ